MIKPIFNIIILILSNCIFLHAQTLDDIARRNIDDAIPLFGDVSDFENIETVQLIGLGDVAEAASESKRLNTAFAAYLIHNKNFRNVFIPVDDWKLRPLNDYLNGKLLGDSLKVDSLFNAIFRYNHKFHNQEFRSFLFWVKKFNASSVKDKVNIIGVTPYTKVPTSYLLSTYIYPVDASVGKKFSEKWTGTLTDEATIDNDIQGWIEAVKLTSLSDEQRLLVNRCEEDLLHNAYAMKLESLDQRIPVETLNSRSKYVADKILENLVRKSIFYSSNTDISMSDFLSPLANEEVAINSIGGFLKTALAGGYYSIGLDYTSTAQLPVVNIDSQSLEIKTIARASKIKPKSGYLSHETDNQLLMGYKLEYINLVLDLNTVTLANEKALTVDALFLLSDLTPIDFTN